MSAYGFHYPISWNQLGVRKIKAYAFDFAASCFVHDLGKCAISLVSLFELIIVHFRKHCAHLRTGGQRGKWTPTWAGHLAFMSASSPLNSG